MTDPTTYSDFPDIQVCACANLRRATRLVTQAYDAALRPAGVRATQFTALAVLGKQGRMSQSALAAILGMDGTTLTRNLKPLLKQGWIRIDRGDDQRVRMVSLEPAGRVVVEEAVPLWRGMQARIERALGKEPLAGLLANLGRAGEAAHQG